MSSYSTYTDGTPSFHRSDRFGKPEYPDTPKQDHQSRSGKYAVKRERSKQDTWKGIFVVTQFWVICFASAGFLGVASFSISKLMDRQILETKDRVSQEHTWFKFAICLRPFMTASAVKEIYFRHLHKNFSDHVQLVNMSNEEKAAFGKTFYLDNTLEPEVYQNYFRNVHPWKDLSLNVLSEYQQFTIERAFEEFLLNTVDMGIEKKDIVLNNTKEGGEVISEQYSVLPPPQNGNTTENQPPMVGEYFLSPIYLGCLSTTLNKEMANKQMDISIKFRPRSEFKRNGKGAQHTSVDRFDAADIFVFNKNESFTEISTIKRNAKFSVMATSRERLLVTSSMFIRQRSTKRNCEKSETNSELTCRKSCVYRGLLDEIKCTLPWMERLREDPEVPAKFASLPKCADLGPSMMLETTVIQETFMSNAKIMQKQRVQKCFQGCVESCKSSMVRILSLGSKSIGNNYGVTLTVSPTIDVVREHFSYSITNMVSELCASVSFLLGLSAIAIYDWLVAFGVWLAVRLGLHVPQEEGKGGATAAAAGSASKTAGQIADPTAAAAAPTTGDVERQKSVNKRRVSVQLPGESPEHATHLTA